MFKRAVQHSIFPGETIGVMPQHQPGLQLRGTFLERFQRM